MKLKKILYEKSKANFTPIAGFDMPLRSDAGLIVLGNNDRKFRIVQKFFLTRKK